MNTFQYLCFAVQMPTMKEMVQNKRAKILVFVVLLFLAIYISKADVPYINYFSSKTVSYCISSHESRTSAIGWIYPDNYDVTIASKFYPQINNSYNTNFQMELNTEWALNDWHLSDWSSVSLILDTRWEDIDIVTSNNEFKHTSESTFHVKTFPISFSVLGDSAEILLCEGWNPQEFPSYVIVLGGPDRNAVLFGHVEKLNSDIDYNGLQTTFMSDNFIVSKESWKSFHLNYDHDVGTLELQTIIDEKEFSVIKIANISLKLKPLYLLTRSPIKQTKWKFENRRFLYTNNTGEVKFGPELQTPSAEICVSLYLSLCKFCSIDFYFYSNESIVYLKRSISGQEDSKEKEWKEVRLLKFDNLEDSIQIYANASFTDSHFGNESGFWAVDEIRACTEDEIKISTIESKTSNLFVDSVTCQSLKHPRWRPKREKLPAKPKGKSLQITKVTSTSVTFKRAPSILTNVYSYNFKALGAKQCNIRYRDPVRQKSNGFLVVSGNEVVFNNLIPYTYYDILVNDAIYKVSENYKVLTSEAQTTYEFELPENLSINTTSSTILITWDQLNCTSKWGGVVYNVNILEKGVLVKSFLQDNNRYDIKGLKSFTNYTIEIITARNGDHHPNDTIKRVYHAQTLPGVAKSVKNAEFYLVDERSLFMRFDVPDPPNGIPVEVRYKTCLSIKSNCAETTKKLKKCKLWPEKYCVEADSLIANKKYYVYITLRNLNTLPFGDPVMLNTVTKLSDPSPPSNLNCSFVINDEDDLCHINITWEHPYLQKSPIRVFEIMITKSSNHDDYESIKEAYLVTEYLPVYSKIIRYIEFSTMYNISVRSANSNLRSEYASITITTDHIGKHLDQSPKLIETTSSSITFTVPILDKRLSSYLLIAIVQNDDKKLAPSESLQNLADDDLCRHYGDSWIAAVIEVSDYDTYNITIGDSSMVNSSTLNETIDNKPLSQDENYCTTFVFVNRHLEKEHVVVYHINSITTLGDEKVDYVTNSSSSSLILVVFGALFTIVGCGIAFWAGQRYLRRLRMNRNVSNNDPIYMSLESLTNAVSNDTYDKLILD